MSHIQIGEPVEIVSGTDSGSTSASDSEIPVKPKAQLPQPSPRQDDDSAEDVDGAGMIRGKQEEFDEEVQRCRELSYQHGNFGNLGLCRDSSVFGVVKGFGHLYILTLSENGLRAIDDDLFTGMPGLTKLDLSNNRLSKVPISALCLQHLKSLLLDHNRITQVPQNGNFSLPLLETIGLEWNQLNQFPTSILQMAPSLTGLFLTENSELRDLPGVHVFARRARRLHLKIDNRPELMRHFDVTLPKQVAGGDYSVGVQWNKIYPDKVMEYVYLGSIRTAQCADVYRDLKITLVLSAGRSLRVWLDDNMCRLELPVDDLPTERIRPFFDEAFKFIDRALIERTGILIHCFAGLSRSVTIMVAYLMQYGLMTRDAALQAIRAVRPAAQPNEGFMRHLLGFERELIAEGFKLSPEPRDFYANPILRQCGR